MIAIQFQKQLQLLSKYLWWEKFNFEDENQSYRILASAMCLANEDDDMRILTSIDKKYLKNTIKKAQAGWFDKKSWSYWHYILGIIKPSDDVPLLPRRGFL